MINYSPSNLPPQGRCEDTIGTKGVGKIIYIIKSWTEPYSEDTVDMQNIIIYILPSIIYYTMLREGISQRISFVYTALMEVCYLLFYNSRINAFQQ